MSPIGMRRPLVDAKVSVVLIEKVKRLETRKGITFNSLIEEALEILEKVRLAVNAADYSRDLIWNLWR